MFLLSESEIQLYLKFEIVVSYKLLYYSVESGSWWKCHLFSIWTIVFCILSNITFFFLLIMCTLQYLIYFQHCNAVLSISFVVVCTMYVCLHIQGSIQYHRHIWGSSKVTWTVSAVGKSGYLDSKPLLVVHTSTMNSTQGDLCGCQSLWTKREHLKTWVCCRFKLIA